jgi:hypothetical protein
LEHRLLDKMEIINVYQTLVQSKAMKLKIWKRSRN